MQSILVVLQHTGEAIADSSLHLCANLNRFLGQPYREIAAVLFGSCKEDSLKSLGHYGIRKVYFAPGPMDLYYSPG